MTRSAELAKGIIACVMLFAAQGCGADFGKDTAKNEKDMKIVVERFLAESESAGSGNVQQIADRLSAMRSQQIDLKEIDPTSVCTKFQTDSVSGMTKVIDAWEGVGSVRTPNPNDMFFDSDMYRYKREQSEAVVKAAEASGNLKALLDQGCSVDSAKPTP